jgi:hypothetical protein
MGIVKKLAAPNLWTTDIDNERIDWPPRYHPDAFPARDLYELLAVMSILGPSKVPRKKLVRWSDEETGIRWQVDQILRFQIGGALKKSSSFRTGGVDLIQRLTTARKATDPEAHAMPKQVIEFD